MTCPKAGDDVYRIQLDEFQCHFLLDQGFNKVKSESQTVPQKSTDYSEFSA